MIIKTRTAFLLTFLILLLSPLTARTAAAASGQAVFVRTDTTSEGSWQSTYGTDGYSLVGDKQSLPSYAALTPQNELSWIWATNTTDPRAVQAVTGSGRIAGTWYNLPTFSIDVNITDGAAHQIALYSMDWDSRGRVQTIQVVDAASGAVLDTRTESNFTNGVYAVWAISGHVRFVLTANTPPNAVVSGVFFGGTGTSGVAHFVTTDTTKQGNWQGTYGAEGYSLVGDKQSVPSYALVTPQNNLSWTWASSTTDLRALQSASGNGHIAATWYNQPAFSIDVEITDGALHQVALYSVDWDSRGRVQTIQVVDAATGAVLDTRTETNFTNGVYAVWTISGHVRFVLTANTPPNSVVSGIFFGPGGTAPTTTTSSTPVNTPTTSGIAHFVTTEMTRGGNWQGAYGAEGYMVVGDKQSAPVYAAITPQNYLTWIWSATTTDTRAPETAAGTSRVAGTWYNQPGFSIDVNVTDGNSHQVAIYSMDWDSRGRVQTIQVVDAATNIVLDSRTESSFTNGVYAVWNISGHVRFVLTASSGSNATVSGVFFGAGGPVPAPTSVASTGPVTNTPAPTTPAPPTNGTSTSGSTSSSSTSNCPPVINAVSFNGIDSTTQGAWKGIGNFNAPPATNSLVYGKDGVILPDTENCDTACNPFPAYVTFGPSCVGAATPGNIGAKPYSTHAYVAMVQGSASVMGAEPQNTSNTGFFQCNFTFSNPAAPWAPMVAWRPVVDTREISNWYTCSGVSSFYLEFSVGNSTHNFEVYVVDDQNGGSLLRSEQIQILDGATNAVLYDSGPFTNFTKGLYYKWSVTGHVKVKVINTSTNGTNAVINGAFFN